MRAALVLSVLGAFTLAGCSGDAPGTGATTSPPVTDAGTSTTSATATEDGGTSSTSSPPPAPRAAMTFSIEIRGSAFVNGTLAIQKGDSVRWTQRDSITHSVAADDGSWGSGPGNDGACPGAGCMTTAAQTTYERGFSTVGDYPYHCALHPGMKGAVTVVESLPGQ